MEAMMRRTLGQLVESFVVGSRTTTRAPAQGRIAWARELSTQVGSRTSAPWHHRMTTATVPLRSSTQTRGFTTKFSSPLRSSPKRSFHSSRPRRSAADSAKDSAKDIPESQLSFSQRMKKLSREYGWSAVGVYLSLSVLDFPFCFLLVRTVGTDRIAVAEEFIVGYLEKIVPETVKTWWHNYRQKGREVIGDEAADNVEMAGWGVKEAEERNKTEASKLSITHICYGHVTKLLNRPCDTTGPGLRYPQELHLCARTPNGRPYAQDRQDPERLGVADWQEARQEGEGAEEG